MLNFTSLLAAAALSISGLVLPHRALAAPSSSRGGDEDSLTITSTAFQNNGMIPGKYSCKGSNINPPLHIGNIPKGTKAIAIIVVDIDAPKKDGFCHWAVWNIDYTMPDIPEGYRGAVEGENDAHRKGYYGPCPPQGTHHYYFKVYALKSRLSLSQEGDRDKLEHAMRGKIMAQGQIIGLYTK